MRVGEKVYCKKGRVNFYKNKSLYKGQYYTILDIKMEKETITIGNTVRVDDFDFHIGDYDTEYYNFCDYFYTTSEIRKRKLKKLKNF